DKKRGTATVQIVDADGRVLKEAVEGVGGLEKLAHVTVAGKVAEGASADLRLISAEAVRAGKGTEAAPSVPPSPSCWWRPAHRRVLLLRRLLRRGFTPRKRAGRWGRTGGVRSEIPALAA